MVELSKKTIAGIIVLLIVLSSGATYYIERTGDYDNCRGDWILQEDGMYQCPQDGVKQWCFDIESRGSGWYRCWIGEVVNIESPPIDIQDNVPKGVSYLCGQTLPCLIKPSIREI